jgi:holo-ACP synthase CitX
MDRAEAALLSRLAALGAAVVERQRYEGRTGSELLLAVGGVDALRLKEAALELEEAQPWARLVDADVLVPGSEGRLGPITREMRGRPPRSCLVCGMPAGPCVREARHGAAELAAAVEALLPA